MRKLICILIIVAMAVFVLYGCSVDPEKALEKEITNSALYELEISADTKSELKLLTKEEVVFSDWDYYQYELKVNGKTYVVGVLRNDVEIHNVDVEVEL